MSTAMAGAASAAPSAPSAPASTPSTPSSSSAPSTSSPTTPASSSSGPSGTGSTSSTGSGGGDPGAKSVGTSPSAAPEAKAAEIARKLKLKVNGREMEMDEGEVVRRAQFAEAADQKFREASDMRKQAVELLDVLKTNPAAVLTKLGLNIREFSEKYLAGELQKEMLTPEQRELQELRDYRASQQKTQQEQELTKQEQARQTEFNQLQQRAHQEYDTKITEVLSETNLPKTPQTVKRVAELLMGALQKGYDLDVQTAVDMVRQGYMTDVQSLFGGLKGEQVIKMLGEATVKEIRQWDLARIKQKLQPQTAEGASASAAPQASRRQEQTQHMKPAEWIEAIRKKAGVED